MARKIFGKVMWVGRTAATVLGLALVLALVFGVATTAIGATGGNFVLGKANSATTVSKLTASVAGPALSLVNRSSEAAAMALNISVASGKAPIKVNAEAGTATNLSADELDGKDSTQFANATHPHSGEDITSGTVAEARIDGTVTRDSEVVPTVKANDGPGSGVDADTLDGQESGKLGQMWAVVDPGCTIVRGLGTSGRAPSNFCGVNFERDISNCAFIASISESGGGYPGTDRTGEVWAYTGDGTANGGSKSAVYVRTANSSGARAALPFHVSVFC